MYSKSLGRNPNKLKRDIMNSSIGSQKRIPNSGSTSMFPATLAKGVSEMSVMFIICKKLNVRGNDTREKFLTKCRKRYIDPNIKLGASVC